MNISLVIPLYNEDESLRELCDWIVRVCNANQLTFEFILLDDGSTDKTLQVLSELKRDIPELVFLQNNGEHGFGRAIICGLNQMKGDAVVIMMADESDDSRDTVRYWRLLQEGYDCVFGSRFIKGGEVHDYPPHKLVLNRLVNWGIKLIFNIGLNDTTNAFKAYRREVIDGCRPLIAPHFNLTVEIPLKAIVRGYTWTTMPISWQNRRAGVPKLKLKEMGSRYIFIILYVWLEKYFSRGDYRRH